ncbi:MAG: MurR/RpiR family transcriptional regulator [Propionibacteriaceae bacterium]|jgi:DNA-binding MurR/RpiR family transcriptional regulator|nr:MurR/RpiR family transcriptional regulator [Propionibacteriaceae bacterium]
MSVQSTIESAIASLSPSERRVAESIRSNPSIVLSHTITELADASATSMATVVRFCRSIGLPGYSHLRMRLATELGLEAAQFGPTLTSGSDIRVEDSLAEALAKIASLEKLAIDETIGAVDLAGMETLVGALDRSSRVVCFGMGASHVVAQDLASKLARLGLNALCPADSHDAWVHAALAPGDAVAIGFSHSGQTEETIRFLDIASEQGVFTVAITSVVKSDLARDADLVVRTVARDTSLRSGAMVSRIAQLCVVDAIAVAYGRLHYEDTVDALHLASQTIHKSI